jgi:hypothetical protein
MASFHAMTTTDYDKTLAFIVQKFPNAAELGVGQLMVAQGASKEERPRFVKLLQSYANAGLGKFIVGRHNHDSRIRWLAPLSVIAKSSAELHGSKVTGTFEHSFQLRDGMDPITIVLPKDFNANEARRFAQFIASLPLV